MSKSRIYLLGAVAASLLVALALAVAWVIRMQPEANNQSGQGQPATNLALDVRFAYDPLVFAPAPYDQTADYPLRLDSSDFSFYGKRIRGLGKMLAKEPAAMLYDFIGITHMSIYEEEYQLRLISEPEYDDATLGGALGVEMFYVFQKGPRGKWPIYFPEYLLVEDESAMVSIAGWVVFTESDLFIFQAVSASPLSAQQRQACMDVINSVQYNALLGTGAVPQPDDSRSADIEE